MTTPLLLALLYGLVLAIGTPPASAQSRAGDDAPVERPEWAVGDWWEVTDHKLGASRQTVVAREKGHYVLVRTEPGIKGQDSSSATKLYADLDGWVTKTMEPGRKVVELGYKLEWVRFPLAVGKSWSFFANAPTVRGGTASFSFFCRAERWDTIRVGDRDVRAVRIACAQTARDGGARGNMVWYAPEAKRVVRVTSDYTGGWASEVVAWGRQEGPGPLVAGAETSRESAPPGPSPSSVPVVEKPTGPAPREPAPPARPPAPPATPPPAADIEPPKIAINYPPPDARVDRESIVITGLVTDNVELARVQIAVNGVEMAEPSGPRSLGRGMAIRAPAALRPGDNLLEVTATDRAGNVTQLVRIVTRADAMAAAPPPPRVVHRWAVVIGVGDYEQKQIPPLRFAVRDAEAVYEFLTTRGGYAKERVVLLTDRTAVKPTLLNIKRALGDFLARQASRDDMVLIYFAGHGAPEIDVAGGESDGLAKYLVPRDGDPESLYTTALPMDELQRIFARIAAERVVMLLDTCYSGTAGGRTFTRMQVRATGLNDQFLERLTRSRGRVIMTASGPNEVALELSKLGHGLFTYHVLEGLNGKADRNGDGIVTVSELYEYVEDQVDRAARLAGGRQRPLMKGEIEGTLPLAQTGRALTP